MKHLALICAHGREMNHKSNPKRKKFANDFMKPGPWGAGEILDLSVQKCPRLHILFCFNTMMCPKERFQLKGLISYFNYSDDISNVLKAIFSFVIFTEN